MSCLIDTGILLRAFDRSFADYRAVRQALRVLLRRREPRFVTLQNLAEFWNVATRPLKQNGYGLSVEQASRRLRWIERYCQVITEDYRSFHIWKALLVEHSLTGVAVHDARLASVMLARHIPEILTLNMRDFRRYADIGVVMPKDL